MHPQGSVCLQEYSKLRSSQGLAFPPSLYILVAAAFVHPDAIPRRHDLLKRASETVLATSPVCSMSIPSAQHASPLPVSQFARHCDGSPAQSSGASLLSRLSFGALSTAHESTSIHSVLFLCIASRTANFSFSSAELLLAIGRFAVGGAHAPETSKSRIRSLVVIAIL